MLMYAHIHTYIFMHIHTYAHYNTYIHTHIHKYILTVTVSCWQVQLSHQRFVRILSSFGLIDEHDQSRTIEQLETIEDDGRAAAKGNGTHDICMYVLYAVILMR